MPKNEYPKCEGQKDVRAKMCRSCQILYNHPRKGTGVDSRLSAGGYVMIMVDNKEVYQHRHIMEKHIGRKLHRKEHVHHIDHDRQNNDIANLEIISASDHARMHIEPRKHEMSKQGHQARWGV